MYKMSFMFFLIRRIFIVLGILYLENRITRTETCRYDSFIWFQTFSKYVETLCWNKYYIYKIINLCWTYRYNPIHLRLYTISCYPIISTLSFYSYFEKLPYPFTYKIRFPFSDIYLDYLMKFFILFLYMILPLTIETNHYKRGKGVDNK